jgi:phage-related protein
MLGKTTAFAGIITGAAGAASAIGPVLSLVSTLVVTAAGLGAVLPAALLSAVAAAAALKIGLSGVGDAIAGDEEALERLPGPAREFVRAVRDLKPAWDDITKAVQGKLFEDVADTFRATAGTILPRLKTGLTAVAGGWNAVFREGLKAATTPRFLTGLDALLKSTGAGLTNMAKGMDGWFRGIGVLLSAVSPLLEDAGEYAGRLGDRFGEWMERAEASGQLQSTLQTMLDTLSMLGGIVTNVGGIFTSVFGAANEHGGGLLGTIESLTGRLDTFLKSAEGESKLGSFFESLRTVGTAVEPIVLALAGAVGELAPKIADIAEGVGPTFADLIEEIGDAIGKIDAENLADGLTDVLDAVNPLIGPIGDFVGGVTEIEGIVPVVAISLGVFTVAVWALNAALYANPIVWIIALIIALIAAVVLIVLNWDSVVASLTHSWEMIKSGAEIIFGGIKDFFVMIWNSIVDSVKAKVADFLAAVEMFSEIPGNVQAWLTDMKDRAVAKFEEFLTAANQKVDNILGAIQRMGGIPGKIAGYIQSAKDQAISKFNSLVDWVKGVPDKIMSALGSMKDLLFGAGKDLLNGLIEGVESMWSTVESKFSELTSMIPNWKGPERVDRDLLKKPAKWIVGGFAEHLQSMFPLVRKVLGGLTSDIGLQVDGAAAPTAAAAPTIVVHPSEPAEFTAVATIDLGENIQRVVEIKLQRSNRDVKRRAMAGTGTSL